jgi:probable H4MPT-linked C1 transfer pathway protein
MLLALDIGGANLKVADGRGWAASRLFALWREPQRLAAELAALLATAPHAETIVATMTGELCDCFATKAEGVAFIVDALCQAASARRVNLYSTSGLFLSLAEAKAQPRQVAAANWHALARFAARQANGAPGMLIDVGSTTTDLVPFAGGQPVPQGATDMQRLAASELVYTGVKRSPACAVVRELVWRGRRCRVAQELFATAWDAYLVLGDLPEEPGSRHTADGRPATRACAAARLARLHCADETEFTDCDAIAAAWQIAQAQERDIESAARAVLARMPRPPEVVVLAGEGEFLAWRVANHLQMAARCTSLAERLGPQVSQAAAAHALAVLARAELGE